MTDTQTFMDEARVVYEDISDKLDACGCDACTRSAADIIATALSSAYQRGREDAAKIADSHAAIHPLGAAIATAIRTERDKG